MPATRETFGSLPDGRTVERYTLRNPGGVQVQLITYGAIITSVTTPDREGNPDEITLGFDTLDEYLGPHPFFGATVGRVANRIGGARFTLDGVEYHVPKLRPDFDWALHGGVRGFDKVLWDAAPIEREGASGVVMSYRSADGEEGFPGNVVTAVTYMLGDDDTFWIEFEAATDKATPINLANHTYWNLAGAGSGDVLDHTLEVNAPNYLPADDTDMVTGEIAPVKGTAFDFTKPRQIGEKFAGIDHCFALRGNSGDLAHAATVHDPASGRTMTVETTQPGVQVYTANHLQTTRGANGRVFEQYGGLCLETQGFPDAVNRPTFPNSILRPGQTYRQVTAHRFTVE